MTNTHKKYTAITGASSGIGYAAAIVFAKRNKNLIVIARRQENLELLQQEIAKLPQH
ncbi:MAG: SDR family NAD(P)-dependent oxidoreductase [Gilliamella sp.]|nr:SDR family NAD(P)-dependent oxidoreductase [Gilliamella sp.]